MTRVEMGVMVMRMNDGLTALRENSAYYAQVCPFTDVPEWAKSSIGFLYDNHLVAGQSATTFGTGDVTKRDYAVMMLRVLGIEHSYEDALAVAVTQGILTEEQASGSAVALRADIVDMTYATLQLLEEQQANEPSSEALNDTANDTSTGTSSDTSNEASTEALKDTADTSGEPSNEAADASGDTASSESDSVEPAAAGTDTAPETSTSDTTDTTSTAGTADTASAQADSTVSDTASAA